VPRVAESGAGIGERILAADQFGGGNDMVEIERKERTMTTDERKVTLLGETATVPEDPRFRIWRDGTCDFRISLGGVTHSCPLVSDYFDGVLALSACEAAIVHFEGICNGIRGDLVKEYGVGRTWTLDDLRIDCENDSDFALAEYDAETWRRILEKVRERP